MKPGGLQQLLADVDRMFAEQTLQHEIRTSLEELRAEIQDAMLSLDHIRRYCRSIGHFRV